jgi:hypothetical protein
MASSRSHHYHISWINSDRCSAFFCVRECHQANYVRCTDHRFFGFQWCFSQCIRCSVGNNRRWESFCRVCCTAVCFCDELLANRLQSIESVVDAKIFAEFGLSEQFLFLLVHSGSRGLGDAILERHTKHFSTAGLKYSSAECKSYLAMHDQYDQRPVSSMFTLHIYS